MRIGAVEEPQGENGSGSGSGSGRVWHRHIGHFLLRKFGMEAMLEAQSAQTHTCLHGMSMVFCRACRSHIYWATA